MACTLAESPSDPLHRKLRQLRCLRCRFDCFYEKVIKVKADVAASLINLFSDVGIDGGDLRGCQGRPEGSVHLDP